MNRVTAVCLSAMALTSGAAAAQDQEPPRYVYEAYNQVSDLQAWNGFHQKYAVPILRQLQSDGVIQGWTAAQHHTGGQYNSRLAIRTYDWASINTFWSEFFSRLSSAVPEGEMNAWFSMSRAHRDDIWELGAINTSQRPTNFMYQAAFQIGFADLEEWNANFTNQLRPILDELVGEGLLGGYVVFNHNTGGPLNWKLLYLFEEWDKMDDFFQQLGSRMSQRVPAAAQAAQLVQAHTDDLWVPVPAQASSN